MKIKSPDGPEFRDLGQHDQDVITAALRSGATRREVMGWLMASGATIGMAGAFVTTASDALAATPKKGGSLRFAWDLHGPSDTLDPILFTSSLDYGRGRIHYNNLCRFNEDLTVGPELATEWEANSTATEWTFKLRSGVEFHDGSKFSADDVVYSMMRHIGEDSPSKAKVLVGSVKEWVKLDDLTVKAVLDAPNAELPIILGTFHFKIVKNGTTDFQNPTGTGPFTLKEFKPGVRSVHEKNDNYWNDAHEGPYLDQIEAFGITDSVARVNALIAGDIQMCANLDPKAIGQIEDAENAEVFAVPSGRYPTITAMMDKEPGNNPDFRMAMKHLQRRDRILKVVQKGVGTLGNDQPVGPAYGAGWCEAANDPNTYQYDLDKAKFHFQKSGITGAEIHVAEVFPGMTDICLMLQREASKVDFDLQIKKVPNDGYWGAVWMKKPMNVSAWNMRPSAQIMLTLTNKSDAPWNEAMWKNERFDQLLAMSAGELDAAKRAEMMCEAQKLCATESGSLIPTHAAYMDAKATNVVGFPRVPIAAFGGMEWPEYIGYSS
ncbi:MAG: ABC transporter substrate-binding protein [Pseudomonadota bacterium]